MENLQATDYNGVRPLDLLLFRTPGSPSLTAQRESRDSKTSEDIYWSHCGVAVDSTVLPNRGLKDGVLYILESTFSSRLTGDIPDSQTGRGKFGVQLRNFVDVLAWFAKRKQKGFDMAYCPLITYPNDPSGIAVKIYDEYRTARYQYNCVFLAASFLPAFRTLRDSVLCYPSRKNVYCSQLCAILYVALDLLPKEFNPADVLPHDFLGNDPDGLPIIVKDPIGLLKE